MCYGRLEDTGSCLLGLEPRDLVFSIEMSLGPSAKK
jgi:hypothetical protein